MNTIAAWITLGAYLTFAIPSIRNNLFTAFSKLGDWGVGILLVPYLLAVEFKPSFDDLLRMIIFLALPTLLLRLRGRQKKPFDVFHILTILAIWIPIETDLFLLFPDQLLPNLDLSSTLSDLYLLPEVSAVLVPGVDLPIQTLIALLLALYLFLIRHPLEGIGFTFRISFQDMKAAIIGLTAFALVGMPIGLIIGFIELNPKSPPVDELIAAIMGGYLLVALMEEVLFRGIIQNLISKRININLIGPMIAAVIFGMAHLNNATPGYPVPNWGYVLMASMAGLAYGWVWNKTRKVTVSAITHMLVNLIWGVVFQ